MAGAKFMQHKSKGSMANSKPETQNPMPFTRVKTGGHRTNPKGAGKTNIGGGDTYEGQ